MAGKGSLEDRLAELEIEFAYQQETIASLNETIAAQWVEIDGLKKEVLRLTNQVKSIESAAPSEGAEPPPPHY